MGTQKRPFVIKAFDEKTLPRHNENEVQLYKNKIQSTAHRNESETTSYIYQNIETGNVAVSSTGGGNPTTVFNLSDRFDKILYANAQAMHSAIQAIVTDVTQTAITILCRPTTLNTACGTYVSFSDVLSSGQVKVFYQVIGTDP